MLDQLQVIHKQSQARQTETWALWAASQQARQNLRQVVCEIHKTLLVIRHQRALRDLRPEVTGFQ